MLKIDHREGKLKALFDKHEIDVHFEVLEYGDMQLLDSNGVIRFIFERKATDDLLASIKDGRYHNQKARLFQRFQPSQVYYIVEGPLTYTFQPVKTTDKILQSSVINMMLRDKIGVFHTSSIDQTFHLLCGVYQRFREDPLKYLGNAEVVAAGVGGDASAAITPHEEHTVVQTSANATPTQVWKAMLCQIPGVSEKSALAIVERYPTLVALQLSLKDLSVVDRVKELQTIKISDRKLNKRIVEGLLTHLF